MSQTSVPVPPGWVRYVVYVDVPIATYDEGDDAFLNFIVNSMVVPRVGETLSFDGPGSFLELVVTAVSHNFSTVADREDADGSAGCQVTVEAGVVRQSQVTARELYESREDFESWIDLFPMVEPRFPRQKR